MLLLIRVGQTILEDTIDQGLVTELGAVPQVGKVVRDVRHALGTGGDDNVGIASDDGLRTDNECLDGRGAHLVDGGRDDRLRETSTNGTLAGRVLAKAVECQTDTSTTLAVLLLCGHNIANKDLLNILRLQTCTLNGSCVCVSLLVYW